MRHAKTDIEMIDDDRTPSNPLREKHGQIQAVTVAFLRPQQQRNATQEFCGVLSLYWFDSVLEITGTLKEVSQKSNSHTGQIRSVYDDSTFSSFMPHHQGQWFRVRMAGILQGLGPI